ncbi:uncharacterized protein PFL1_03938 [Pseudozyma flocculosa PF-1]|uniref:Related to cAMP-independent regulatory protein pac2 n=2 Tax=Pseudozyma flocculosa TaxID=84751 RepID=A0A5C3EZI6_9BASI|nr:uncharacterized protein PFL1_03938 [Pseudozyma flocculosa PF-1]EPQ28635.1 hypothetical protein PFL1_03938 [Pseudozyma flocculosa PF-1]SPO36579.1 related to cAMP-independent regulatory protein pac2 [Pseudozyma flocculosa]
MQPSRHNPRPDLMRSQTTARGYGPGNPPAPQYPDYGSREYRHHPPASGYYPPSLPNLTRQHHSYYDERGPLPPPPLHARHPGRDEAMHEYAGRPLMASATSTASSAMFPHPHPHPHHYPHHHPHQPSYPSSVPSLPLHGLRAPAAPMMAAAGSSQQPTYRGHIKTTKDAILLLSACDLPEGAGSHRNGGIAPPRRVTRRLLDSERADLICSGSIFVWDEKEAGMRRWTDGKCWSASRVSGCFLTYRELEARKKPSSSITGGPTSNLYKTEGLIKQSFSMTTTSGRKLHAISYYTKRDVREGALRRVSEDPRFVGEGGGEWDLQVDEHEYPDPISRAGELPDANGQEVGSQSPPSLAGRADGGDAPGSSSLVDDRELIDDGAPISPRCQAPSHRLVASPSTAQRSPRHHDTGRGTVAWSGHPGSRKDFAMETSAYSRQRAPFAQDATPLHEARGLLPIKPIPVQSRVSDLPLKPTSRSFDAATGRLEPSSVHVLEDQAHGSYFRQPMPSWAKGGLKRSYADYAAADEQMAAAVAAEAQQRPKLQRMRSSSMNNGSGEDAFASVRTLARAGSDEEGVSKMRSTHTWSPAHTPAPGGGAGGPPREQDSAVGALLSLRSSASDDSSKMPGLDSMLNPSPSTSTPTSIDSSNDSASKPSLSRSDRAALDRFSIRI